MAEPGDGGGLGQDLRDPTPQGAFGPELQEVSVERTSQFTGREWVFRAVDDWLGVESARRLLLVGKPGTGKSALAARLLEMSRGDVPAVPSLRLGRGFISAAHFCHVLVDPTLDPARIFEDLAGQLADRYPGFRQALAARAAEGGVTLNIVGRAEVVTAEAGAEVSGVRIAVHIEGASARSAFDRLLRRPLEALCRDGFNEQIVILVDGLDEALAYGDQPTLVEVLRAATDAPEELPSQVRFLFTSRPDPRVTDQMAERVLDLVVDAPFDEHDVRDYVDRRLAAIDLAAEARRTVAERVARAGQGNFLYARYVVNDLLAHRERLQHPAELALPTGLESHYEEFLERELVRRAERWEERYRPLVGALAVARGDGLTRSQLQGVTTLPRSRVDDALAVLSQYLSAPTREGPFRLYHESFRDFLIANERYPVYPAEAHEALAVFFTTAYRSHWAGCADEYALLYTTMHLREALRQRHQLSNAAANHLERVRSELDTDPEFEAAAAEAQLLVHRTRGFTARRAELKWIDQWIGSDDPRVMLIVGSPGSGKSALAAQVVHIARSGKYTASYPGLTTNVFAIYSAFDPVKPVGLREFSYRIGQKISARHPSLLSWTPSFDPLTARDAVQAVSELLWRIQESGEMTLIVADALDEIELFEPAINEWLAQLGNTQIPNLRLLATSRATGFDQRQFPPENILIIQLYDFDAREMRDYMIAQGIPPDLAGRITDFSQGSPLIARRIVETFRSSPERFEKGLELTATADREALVLGLIRARLAANGPDRARILMRMLRTIAKASTPMTPPEIASVLAEPLPEVREAIAAASDLLIADEEGRMSLFHQIFVDVLSNLPEELQ